MDPAIYTQTVVDKAVQKNPPEIIWAGQSSNFVWLLELLGMHWFYGYSLSRKYRLNMPIARSNKTSL
jgi:hypothetical protein